jgi:acetylglutamate kinase
MAINAEGGKAVGLCGKDGNMVIARKLSRREVDPESNIEKVVDLGFVGEPETVNRSVIDMVSQAGLIPVIAPVAPDRDGATYNINADTFAGAIAGALNATRLLFLTDVPGVLDRDGKLIKQLTAADARALIQSGVISGGMIPKVETSIEALEHGVEGVVILNGATPHAVLLELFTEAGAGTLITK